MKTNSLSFVCDGKERMREAVNAQVRRENDKELSLANDFWKKIAIEKKIYREVKARMKRFGSPHILWISR